MPQWPPGTQLRFCDVPRGAAFFLTPPNTHRLMFIKTHERGAQVNDPSNDSSAPDQEFPPDYPVFLHSPVRK